MFLSNLFAKLEIPFMEIWFNASFNDSLKCALELLEVINTQRIRISQLSRFRGILSVKQSILFVNSVGTVQVVITSKSFWAICSWVIFKEISLVLMLSHRNFLSKQDFQFKSQAFRNCINRILRSSCGNYWKTEQ